MQVREPLTAIEYPSSDGKPMAETDKHIQLMGELRFTLLDFYRDESDVYVAADLLLYYVEGDPRRRVAPDVFVVRGVANRQRRIYKLWEEGRPPDFVIELSSRQLWREDLQEKWRLYEQLGVREYFIFDPEYDYLDTPLVGYRLGADGLYAALEVENNRLHSETLDLDLVDTGETLRLFEPRTDRFLPTPLEDARARRQAEAEAASLRQELARLCGEAT